MKTLTVMTTNRDKKAAAARVFAESSINIDFIELETPEIQAYTCEEVASASVAFVYDKIQKPVAVTDAGYFIPALNGFPGPFLKYINTMLRPEDILRMMENKTDRRIDLLETIAYMDATHSAKTFTSVIRGTLAREIRGEGRLFDSLFIPEGFTQTAAELDEGTMSRIYVDRFTHWCALQQFLEQ